MSPDTFGNGEPPRGTEGNGEPPQWPAGNGEPPRFGALGPIEPPRSGLQAALQAYYDGERSEVDVLVYAGLHDLDAYLTLNCDAWPDRTDHPNVPAPARPQQSRRNWSFTVAQLLSRRVGVRMNAGTAWVDADGSQVWSGTPLAGEALAAQCRAALARAATARSSGRMIEIASQAAGIELMFALELRARPQWRGNLAQLIEMASAVLAGPLYDVKARLAVRRPSDLLNQPAAPAIPVPGHASFPSGHATVSHALAELLATMLPAGPHATTRACRLRKLAERMADNRMQAGLHTQSDTDAGAGLGRALGAWLASPALHQAVPAWGALHAAAATEI